MIKNLIVRAKNVIEEMDLNGTSPGSRPTGSFKFDDTYFTCKLEGGPTQSELIVASASVKHGITYSPQ